MSIGFELGLCEVSDGLPITPAMWARLEVEVAQAFAANSSGEIKLKVSRVTSSDLGIKPVRTLTDDDLQKALFAWTGDQSAKNPIKRLGLLVGGSFEGQSKHFGYMFDQVFRPNTSNPWLDTPAREGCVVFADAIASKRQPVEFADELVFTAIHEMGHVFNLQHDEPPKPSHPTFMMRSADVPAAFDLADCRFDEADRGRLTQCATSPYVRPGGSNFEDLGPFGAGNGPLHVSQRADEALALRISTIRSAYWFFEPIELDLEVSLSDVSTASRATVPDMLDPGYSQMVIWIEEPSGARRRYRSPRRYCAHARRREITVSQPIRRDVSIFGEAGGYTFREIGVHRVFVTWQLSATRALRSNVIEIAILPPRRSAAYMAAERTLVDPDRALLMYRRGLDARRMRKLSPMEDYCRAYPRQAGSAMMNYALGRAFTRKVLRAIAFNQPVAAHARKARKHLLAAIAYHSLGERRHEHCQADLSSLPVMATTGREAAPTR